MFVSTDRGRTWSRVGAGYNVSTLDPRHPRRMVGPTFRSLLTTNDGGINWRRADLARCATPLDGATSQDPWFGGIFRSTDAGRSFKRVGSWDPDAVTVDPSDPKTLYAATQDGLFKSTSAGDSWDHIGDRDTLPYWQVLVSPSNAEVVYAVADGHRFLDAANGEGGSNQLLTRSTDGWKTWKVILDIFDIAGVAVDPRDPNTIYVDGERINPRTGVGVFMVSHDGGTSWQTLTKEKTSGGPTLDPTETQGPNAGGSLFVDPTDPDVLYQQRRDAVARSTDGGRTFRLLHPPA